MQVREWRRGDRVIHRGKPEWGVGEITAASASVLDNRSTQTLTIRFASGGLRTVLSAAADLAEAEGNGAHHDDPLFAKDLRDRFARLPDEATDPFTSLEARLNATCGLYRFTGSGGSLVDWAVLQSGLTDPLSRFSRHELEELFQRFRTNLEQHLRALVLDAKRKQPEILARVNAAAPPAAQQLLRRFVGAR